MIPRRGAKLYDVQYEYVRNYLYAKMPTTDDVDTWSIDPSKKILVYLSACSKSLGVMFRWKYRESYYVLTLETQSRSDRASKIRIASVQSLNYLYCGRANPTSIGSGCNGCHMISDQVMKEKTGNANTKGSDVISRSKVSCLDIIW